MDWKDTLQALQSSGTLPAGTDPVEAEEKAEVSRRLYKLNIAVEKKGRGGKTATIVYGFEGSDDELQALARMLRQRLGTGGSARGGEILLQGDRKTEAAEILRAEGYKVGGVK